MLVNIMLQLHNWDNLSNIGLMCEVVVPFGQCKFFILFSAFPKMRATCIVDVFVKY